MCSPYGNAEEGRWTYESVSLQLANLGVFLNDDGSMYIREEGIKAGYHFINPGGRGFYFVPVVPGIHDDPESEEAWSTTTQN
jgi:hypothetical protein